MRKEELLDEIEESVSARLNFKTLSKDRLPERKFDEKIHYLFKKIHSSIKKQILKFYLKKNMNIIVVDDIIKYVKSFKIIPKGEIDFYYYFKFKIFSEYLHLEDVSISFILEHKFGGGKKIVYQIFRDLIYEISNNKEDLVICLGIYKGKYLYTILSARKHEKGYIISSYNLEKFFPDSKNKSLFLTNKKIGKILENYFENKKGMSFIKRSFDRIFL